MLAVAGIPPLPGRPRSSTANGFRCRTPPSARRTARRLWRAETTFPVCEMYIFPHQNLPMRVTTTADGNPTTWAAKDQLRKSHPDHPLPPKQIFPPTSENYPNPTRALGMTETEIVSEIATRLETRIGIGTGTISLPPLASPGLPPKPTTGRGLVAALPHRARRPTSKQPTTNPTTSSERPSPNSPAPLPAIPLTDLARCAA